MNYKQSLEYVESLQQYGIVPGLDSIKELCCRLGNPQDKLKFVHIAGTNGKGSVLAYISTILKCAGYRVGRYLSPVIVEYREKIQVNGRFISQKDFCDGIETIRDACEQIVADGKPHPTPFEVETALAFWYFARKECDIVVLETGMGGLEDATNIIQNTEVAVLSSISMDHMKFLGKTLGAIAANKAGIIKEGCQVVSCMQAPEALTVIEQCVKERGCTLQTVDREAVSHVKYGLEKQSFDYKNWKKLTITLAGKHQIDNAILALEAISALAGRGFEITDTAIYKGLRECVWPGRFSVIGKKPYFVVDGAHNEDAAQKLAESIEFYFTNKRIIYIMGILKDKEYEKIIQLTHRYADQIITITPPENPRAMHAYELAQEIVKLHPNVTAVDSLEEACEVAYMLAGRDDVILAFGSLSYLGKLMDIVSKRKGK